MRLKSFVITLVMFMIVTSTASYAGAQSSSKTPDSPKGMRTAQTEPAAFAIEMSQSDAFDAALKYFQLLKPQPKGTLDIDKASKEIGQVVISEVIDTGGFRNNNTGITTTVKFIKDSPTRTQIVVNVDVKKRTKHLKAEDWTNPKPDAERAAAVTTALKQALENTTAAATPKQ